jgi:transposase
MVFTNVINAQPCVEEGRCRQTLVTRQPSPSTIVCGNTISRFAFVAPERSDEDVPATRWSSAIRVASPDVQNRCQAARRRSEGAEEPHLPPAERVTPRVRVDDRVETK